MMAVFQAKNGLILAVCLIYFVTTTSTSPAAQPNIVIFLADDLGIGDVGCYGNTTIKTPNIDQLARDGVKLTHHLAADSLCTPSRAAMLTGRYAVRMGLGRGDNMPAVVMYSGSRAGVPNNETSWATLLQKVGYHTGAVGKWHLGWDVESKGDNLQGPLGHGFQYFFGLPWTLVAGFELEGHFFSWNEQPFLKDLLLKGTSRMAYVVFFYIVSQMLYKSFGLSKVFLLMILLFSGWFITEHTRLANWFGNGWWQRSMYMDKFLNSQLMLGSDIIAEQPIKLEHLTHNLTARAIDYIIESSEGTSQPFAMFYSFPNPHVPLNPNIKYRGKTRHGPYGDSILEMDTAIGEVLAQLKKSGIEENTLVYFASDHGAHIDLLNDGGSNYPFKGGKTGGAWEGGIRIPGIIKWPGVVKPGSEIATPTGLIDWLPTVWEIAGGKSNELPDNVDGVSYAGLLTGKEETIPRQFMRHYSGQHLHALRLIDGNETSLSIAKAYYRRSLVNEEGHCGYFVACGTEQDTVEDFGLNPLIFDLVQDPLEDKPLDRESQHYQELKNEFNFEFVKAKSEFYPETQLTDPLKIFPMPWLQPCANFPRCSTEPPQHWTEFFVWEEE